MKNTRTRTQRSTLVFICLCAAILATIAGCDDDPVGPVKCRLVDGQVWVLMAEGVRADSALKVLDAVGLPYDRDSIQDCYILYFLVTEGDPTDQRSALQQATGAGVVGTSTGNKVFASLCDTSPSSAIAAGSAVPGLEFDRIWWFSIDTIVTVPVGEEDEWAAQFLEMEAVANAQQLRWCPI